MSSPKVACIIQARMNSTRLPGKVLLPLAGKSALLWCIERCQAAKLVDDVVVATTNSADNKAINFDSIGGDNYSIFRHAGDEENVLERVLACAKENDVDVIVEVTGDCQFIDFRMIDNMVDVLLKDNTLDYASNCVTRSWPDGLDLQAYWTSSLETLKAEFSPENHVGWNFTQQKDFFRIMNFPAPEKYNRPEIGITLDTKSDYILMSKLFDVFGHTIDFRSVDVIDYLLDNPELLEINKKITRKDPAKEG